MRKLLVVVSMACGILLAGCEPFDPCPGQEVCGSGCMDIGGSCCPDGQHHCNPGYYCASNNLCYSTGGGGGGNTCPVNTCINNLCSPGLWCCSTPCSGCGCQ